MEQDGPLVVVDVRDASESRVRPELLRARVELLTALLRGASADEAIATGLPSMRRLLGADVAWVALETTDGDAALVARTGRLTSDTGLRVPLAGDDVRRVLEEGRVVTEDSARDLPSLPAAVAPRNAPLVVQRLAVRAGGRVGILAFGRHEAGRTFSRSELDVVAACAAQVSDALALSSAQHEAQQEQLLADRDRTARDLHDTVVQQLYAIGLRLEAVRPRAAAPVAERIVEAVAGLDTVIADLRTAIFDLHTPIGEGAGLRRAVLRRTHGMHDVLGFVPHVRFVGEVDTTVTDAQAEQLLAVLAEALSNVARHARATDATVVVDVTEAVRLTVSDDGVGGARSSPGGRGLENLRARAQASGGTFSVRERATGGTVLTWSVPRR